MSIIPLSEVDRYLNPKTMQRFYDEQRLKELFAELKKESINYQGRTLVPIFWSQIEKYFGPLVK